MRLHTSTVQSHLRLTLPLAAENKKMAAKTRNTSNFDILLLFDVRPTAVGTTSSTVAFIASEVATAIIICV